LDRLSQVEREALALQSKLAFPARQKERKARREALLEEKVQKMDVEMQHRVIGEHKHRERKDHRAEMVPLQTPQDLYDEMEKCGPYTQQQAMIIGEMRAIESQRNLKKVFTVSEKKNGKSVTKSVEKLRDELVAWLLKHPPGKAVSPEELRRSKTN
jgi:hypothetical protein